MTGASTIAAARWARTTTDEVARWRNTEQFGTTRDMGSLTKLYTGETIAFLQRQRRESPFLDLAHTLLHVVIGASGEFLGSMQGGLYGDTLREIDHRPGRLLDSLEKLGLADNIYVLFASGNGPWSQLARAVRYFESHAGHIAVGAADGLRSAWGSSWEGGLRVPAILRAPAGSSPGEYPRDSVDSGCPAHVRGARRGGSTAEPQARRWGLERARDRAFGGRGS